MSGDGEQALVSLQGQEGALCESCSQIPWDQLVDGHTDTSIPWETIPQEWMKSACRICRFLDQFLSQYESRPTKLHFEYEAGILKFEGLLKSKDVCSIHAREARRRFRFEPEVLVSRVEPCDVQHTLGDIFPGEVDVSKLRSWIADCEDQHSQHCTLYQRPNLIGLKVIDCEYRAVVNAPPACKFAALSYVWGDSRQQSTNLSCWSEVPKTIQDSIRLTEQLGLRYLWVDRYCIDQDSPQEKHTQISQMGYIYSAANVTIIAAAGNSPYHGLPGVRPTRRGELKYERIGQVYLYALGGIAGLSDVDESEWARRAWTYQEGFLARRRLIFTERQVIYLCNTALQYEATTKPYVDRLEDFATGENRVQYWVPSKLWEPELIDDDSPMERATMYLEKYSERKLSYDADALSAVLGALKTLFEEDVYHICGVPIFLPTPTLPDHQGILASEPCGEIALFWYHKDPARRRDGFPSWSSVGWDGAISWETWGEVHTVDIWMFRLLSKSGEYNLRIYDLPNAPLDSVQFLKFNGQVADCTPIHATTALGWWHLPRDVGIMFSLDSAHNVVLWPDWDISFGKDEELPCLSGVFFHGEKDYAVLLRAHGDHYERVGILSVYDIFSEQRVNNAVYLWIGTKDMQPITKQEHEALAHASKDLDGRKWWERIVRTETIVWG